MVKEFDDMFSNCHSPQVWELLHNYTSI